MHGVWKCMPFLNEFDLTRIQRGLRGGSLGAGNRNMDMAEGAVGYSSFVACVRSPGQRSLALARPSALLPSHPCALTPWRPHVLTPSRSRALRPRTCMRHPWLSPQMRATKTLEGPSRSTSNSLWFLIVVCFVAAAVQVWLRCRDNPLARRHCLRLPPSATTLPLATPCRCAYLGMSAAVFAGSLRTTFSRLLARVVLRSSRLVL